MTKRKFLYLFILLILLTGVAVLMTALRRPVTILLNDKKLIVETTSLTVGSILNDSGIVINTTDSVSPDPESFLTGNTSISVQQSSAIQLWVDGVPFAKPFWTLNRTPKEILAEAGLSSSKNDLVFWNGRVVDPINTLPFSPRYDLQIHKSDVLTFQSETSKNTIQTDAKFVGAALWQMPMQVVRADFLSAAFDDLIPASKTIVFRRAMPITVQSGNQEISGVSAAATVGQALSDLGIPLQGLDICTPGEDQPVPENGTIKVVRIHEEIILQQETIPYKSEYQADSQIELDQQKVSKAGIPGLKVTRLRVRFENGKEISREPEAQWIAQEPQSQITSYGTKVVIRTLQTSSGTIEYWRAVRVYTTSFAPCEVAGHCSFITASGKRLTKGIIGTGPAWYNLLSGQSIFIDGYGVGVVADYGYVPGYWIDLGYDDANYQPWSGYHIAYFLTPVPANIPWILPK